MLAGRHTVMSYPGWLFSWGIDYSSRERDVRTMYALAPGAADLFRKYGVDYVVIGSSERDQLGANEEAYRSRYTPVIQTANYEVFAVGLGKRP
jgi:uncharacterized membrane protein